MEKQRYEDLHKLGELMNQMTTSPLPLVEEVMSCFDAIITPEDNQFLLKMGTSQHSYNELLALSGKNKKEFKSYLMRLMKNGLILHKHDKNNKDYYELHSIFVGWFEFIMMDDEISEEKKEFARRVNAVFTKLKNINFFPIRTMLNNKGGKSAEKRTIATIGVDTTKKPRIIELNRKVKSADAGIYPAGSVLHYIEKFDKPESIAVANCFCRNLYKTLGEPCRFDIPVKSCMLFGDMAKQMVEIGYGKFITKDKAIKLANECQKKGAIMNVLYEYTDLNKPEMALCNCCSDCCGALGSYNRGFLSLNYHSYYIAKLDSEKCKGCGTCVKYCATDAIRVIDGKSVRQLKKCIGCGQCAFQCPNKAVEMTNSERKVFVPIQKKSEARYK